MDILQTSSYSKRSLVERAKNMLVTPKTEWNVVSAEIPNQNKIFTGYVLPFVVLIAIAAFIGYGLFLTHILKYGLFLAITQLIVITGSVFLTALIVDVLAPSFKSEKNYGRSLQLVVYGYTPVFVASLLYIVLPFIPLLLSLVMLAAAAYGIYLWYLGLGPIKHTPEDQKIIYLVVIFIISAVLYYLIGLLMQNLFISMLVRPLMLR